MNRVSVGYIAYAARLHVSFGGSGGMMTTARPELPTRVVPRPKLGTSILGGGSSVTG